MAAQLVDSGRQRAVKLAVKAECWDVLKANLAMTLIGRAFTALMFLALLGRL